MDEIETSDLSGILLDTGLNNIKEFNENYLGSIDNSTFSSYYLEVLEEHHRTKAEAIANSGLEVHYAYQILKGIRNPTRDKRLCLCIGGGLTVQETNRALERDAVGNLYPKRLRDAVIILAINSGIDKVWQVNELLEEQELDLLM